MIRDTYNVAMNIDSGDRKFFFSDDFLEREENFGQETVLVYYQPKITNFESSNYQLSFDQQSPVQTLNISIMDAKSEFFLEFDDKDFESASVKVLLVKSDEVVEFRGYIADLSHNDGQTSFAVRLSEGNANISILNQFTGNTFQKYETIIPKTIDVKANWSKIPQVPWTIYRKEFNRFGLPRQPVYERGGVTFRDTAGKLAGVIQTDRILLTNSGGSSVASDFIMKEFNIATADIDPNTPGATDKYLLESDKGFALFKNYYSGITGSSPPIPPNYYTAWLGPGHFWTDKNSPEIIRYAWFGPGYYDRFLGHWVDTSGDNEFWLSGIPAAENNDTYTASSLDPAGLLGAAFAENNLYTIKRHHTPGDIISAADGGVPGTTTANHDTIWFKANGFVPNINDAEFGVGFLHLGKIFETSPYYFEVYGAPLERATTGDGLSNVLRAGMSSYKVFHRYRILEVVEDVYDYEELPFFNKFDSTETFTLIKVAIQDHVLDTVSHPFAVKIPMACGYIEPSMDEESQVEMYTLEYMVSQVDLLLNNLDQESYNELINVSARERLKDRYRGLRLDFLRDFDQFKAELSNQNFFNLSESDAGQVQFQNASILDNATELFAVCAGSEILYGDPNIVSPYSPPDGKFVERLTFHVPDVTGPNLAVFVDDPENDNVIGGTVTGLGLQGVRPRDKIFSNYLTYKPIFRNSAQISGLLDLGKDQVDEFFARGRFKIIYDPVPENSQDLGNMFPIVYGYVKKAPMLHVVSNKSLFETNETAGDDIYIYSSHPTGTKSASDIQIEFVQESNNRTTLTDASSREREISSLKDEFAKSPFPNIEQNHYYWASSSTTDAQGRFSGSIAFYGKINTPYHKIVEKESNDGYTYYCVQLRGGEWDDRVGRLDKRYPVRNGFGNTVLYASFPGWINEDGKVIEHPVDIISHFITTYGQYPENTLVIDEQSAEALKSKTVGYKASVYITENIGLSDFIDDLCKQFGFYWFTYGGKIYFSNGEIDFIKYEKTLSERKNILREPSVSDEGYNEIYTRVIYKYGFNYVTGNYDGEIELNKNNNASCAKNAKARGGSKDLVIEGKYQYKYSVAKRVALKYAKYLATRQIKYKLEIRKEEGLSYLPGDIVPIEYSRLGVDRVPVMIVSVKESYDRWMIDVIRFPDIEYDEIVFEPPPDISPPAIVSDPVISGVMKQGQLLTCTTGTWTEFPFAFSYQWRRDGIAIGGATSSTYTVVPTDIPAEITCTVIAINLAGASLPSNSNILTSNLRPIFQINAGARVWTHEQGISDAIGATIQTWTSVDGLWTFFQDTSLNRPLRDAGGVSFNGTAHWMIGDAHASIFNGDYSCLTGFTDPHDINLNTRTLWGAFTDGVSSATRRCSRVDFGRPGSPSSTRMRYLLGANSAALVISLAPLGVRAQYDLACRSLAPSVGNPVSAVDLDDPLVTIGSGAWASVAMANDLFTIGANRLTSSYSSVFLWWQGKIKYFIIMPVSLGDAELDIVRDALIAEGLI